jgi:hypothetical protein
MIKQLFYCLLIHRIQGTSDKVLGKNTLFYSTDKKGRFFGKSSGFNLGGCP